MLLLLLTAFAILALIYARATPPLEASDELWHFGLVMQLATTGDLPVQDADVTTAWRQEGSQPPLYYALVSAGVRLTGVPTDFDAARQPNPHAQAGVPLAVGNKNLVLHPTPPETARAVLIGRLISIALSLITVAAVYASARVIAPSWVALLAGAITAFNPMFLFISASINNDTLVIALNSLIIWLVLVTLRDGFSTRRSLLIALLVALASLSKLSGLVLVPVIALMGLMVARRQRDLRGLMILGGAMGIAWSGIAGWWYLRNLQLYGELFGTTMMAAVAGMRTDALTIQTLLSEFEGFRIAYWGWFGGVNILTFPAFYPIMDAITLIAVSGAAIYGLRQRHQRPALLLLGLTLVIGAGGVIAWTVQTYASQGRLLFPLIAAISPLLALGLATLLRRASFAIALLMGVVAFAIPFSTLAPAYRAPAPLTALPASAQPVYARFGDVELIGYETPDRRYLPGDSIPITVYWKVLQPSERDLSLWLHGLTDKVVGRVDSYPGGGTLRTSLWMPGIYADTYAIPTDANATGRDRLRVQVGWWDYPSGRLIPPTDANGSQLDSVMLDAGAFGRATTTLKLDHMVTVEGVSFGGVIALRGYTLEGDQLALLWEATGTPSADDTVFVQVLDAAGEVFSQSDAPPDLPTHYWQVGEHTITRHTITYSGGDQRLIIGWYAPDGVRLTTDRSDDAYVLIGG